MDLSLRPDASRAAQFGDRGLDATRKARAEEMNSIESFILICIVL